MNFKRNYRFDLQPSWVRELSFSVYKKPKRFYMSDAYNYGEEVEHGTLIADEHISRCRCKRRYHNKI